MVEVLVELEADEPLRLRIIEELHGSLADF
jgi:hypothetical protein